MQRLFVPLAGFLLGLCALAAYGQTHPNNSDPAPASTIQSTAQEVVLDMVFRDRKGKTIRDLRPEEIRISEDGVEQKVTSFRLLDGKTVRSLDAHQISRERASAAGSHARSPVGHTCFRESGYRRKEVFPASGEGRS